MTALRFVRAWWMLAAFAAVSWTAELDKYRDFRFGSSLATIAKQAGADPAQANVIHRRPALIQELTWRPQPLGWSSKTEPVQEVVFSFHNGEMFRVVVDYDRHETEGLTADDMVEAVSTAYGSASKPTGPVKAVEELYGAQRAVLATWQDGRNRFDLLAASYGPTYRLIGVQLQLEAAAQAAIVEALRLDEKEAPQRDAARIASEEDAAKAKLEKARLVNKPKFRP